MKVALITPFVYHFPLHPSSYLGYGAAILKDRFDLDIRDLNAEVYYKNRDRFNDLLCELDSEKIVSDGLDLAKFDALLSQSQEEVYENIAWGDYQSVFITAPSWFVTIPTESVLRISDILQEKSPDTRIFFFGNSLGTWTDEKALRDNNVQLVHLNNLFERDPINRPVDFDALPTPFYEQMEKYLFNILPFRLKHGCIWGGCKFCSLAKGWNSGYMERSPRKIIQELEKLIYRYNPAMMVSSDNAINGDNLIQFCSYFKEFRMPWGGMARADLSVREIKKLSEAGCRTLYFGLESGSDNVLEKINKGIRSGQMSDFIKALFDHNIMPVPSLLVGAPVETGEDFEKTVHFIVDHERYLDLINVFPFKVHPTSEYHLDKIQPGPQTLTRLMELLKVCKGMRMKVCVGEQSAEYFLCKMVFPEPTNY
ncbi:MAG: radical SAM protein [Desulfobacteraceae bacterium]|nr:radical SAM protein [Desulfobacteraceae bacterium]